MATVKKCSAKPPIISVVTPSFNQGAYLEACIDSVLSQKYPNLEFIIMDGGSTDNSLEIIKKYADHLTYWQSRPDGGQYAAVNAGFQKSTGDIMTWLNSDDKFHPQAFDTVAALFSQREDVDWIMGRPNQLDEGGRLAMVMDYLPLWSRRKYLNKKYHTPFIRQEGTFWRRVLWESAGACLQTDLKLAGDLELWVRFFRHSQLVSVDALLAGYRVHARQKAQMFWREYLQEAEAVLNREIKRFAAEKGQVLLPPPIPVTQSEIEDYRQKHHASLIYTPAPNVPTVEEPDASIGSQGQKVVITPEKSDASSVERYVATARAFWNVDSCRAAMFERVFTDEKIGQMPLDQKNKAWQASAERSAEQVLDGIPWQAEWRVLEIGCGVGRILKPLRNLFAWVDGVDIAEKMIEYAGRYLADGGQNGKLYVNNGYDLRMLTDKSYDFVYSTITFQHIRSAAVVGSYLDEIKRVLRPGGFFRLQVHDTSNAAMGRFDEEAAQEIQYSFAGNAYTAGQLRSALEAHGYEIHDLSEEPPWIWATVRKPVGMPSKNQLEEGLCGCHPRKRSHRPLQIFPESDLAHRWLDGLKGLEIGPSAHNPFGLNTRYVGLPDDIYDREQLKRASRITPLDIIATADDIPVPSESEDFIISFHVIEHCPDLIRTLLEWFRIIRPGGYIFMIVPHRDAAPSDAGKPLTTWPHHYQDYANQQQPESEPDAGKFGHCHYHVFSPESMQDSVRRLFGPRLERVAFQAVDDKDGSGFTLVYRKTCDLAQAFPWQIHFNGSTFIENPPPDPGTQSERLEPDSAFRVSAIVSTYNAEKFIHGCLQDLFKQTLYRQGALEIIVIDSGSRENEGRIVQKLQKTHPHLKYIRTEQRETVYQAWNRGIQAATGEFITTCNTDDRHRADALEVMADELTTREEIALVYGDVFVTCFENQPFEQHIRCGYHIRPDYHPSIMLSGCHMGPQPMWRRTIHAHLGYFDDQYHSAGDYEFWCRIARQYPMRHISQYLGLYYENPRGICNADKALSARETLRIQKKYATVLPPPEHPLDHYIRNYQFTDSVVPNQFVNIGMVTFNRLEFTKQSIAALIEHTRYPHVLTVVDNASTDGTRDYLVQLHRQGVIQNLFLLNENAGVAKASNLAWEAVAQAAYYMKLDNDIVVQKPDWLNHMVRIADSVPWLGAVAYNFEPYTYPLSTVNGHRLRIKKFANLGGACILIPKRTREALGGWCEDYGLYGEEDADYGERIRLSGRLNAYMADEHIGIHLPGGRAARIDAGTLSAADGVEEQYHSDYRRWKDDQRKKIIDHGLFAQKKEGYQNGSIPLKTQSLFAENYFRQGHDERLPQEELLDSVLGCEKQHTA